MLVSLQSLPEACQAHFTKGTSHHVMIISYCCWGSQQAGNFLGCSREQSLVLSRFCYQKQQFCLPVVGLHKSRVGSSGQILSVGCACSENRKLRFLCRPVSLQYVWLVALLFSSHSSANSGCCSHLPSVGLPLGRQLVMFVLRQPRSLNYYCLLSCLDFCHGYILIQKFLLTLEVSEQSRKQWISKDSFCFFTRCAGQPSDLNIIC